jgi:hypothetical protein
MAQAAVDAVAKQYVVALAADQRVVATPPSM